MAAKNNKSKAAKKNTPPPEPVWDTLEIDDVQYQTLVPEWTKNRKPWRPKEEGEIVSQIAGIVREIFVEQGARVETGSRLMVLEAMKMYNEILSPVDGVVEAVLVESNVNYPKGTLMIKIKEEAKKEAKE